MRMNWIILTLLVVAWPSLCWADGNYILTMNGTKVELNLDVEQKHKLPDGSEVTLKLERKSTSTFKTTGVSFEYPGALNVATTEISKDTYQHMLASARGTVILVQTYPDIDASQLVELMTGKMTDDDVAAGEQRETKPFSRTLADGTVVTGTLSTLKAPGNEAIVEVLAIRQGRGGTMLITRTDRDIAPDEGSIIERFWASLSLH